MYTHRAPAVEVRQLWPSLRSWGMGPLALLELTLDCPEPRALAAVDRPALGWSHAPGHQDPDPDGDDWTAPSRT